MLFPYGDYEAETDVDNEEERPEVELGEEQRVGAVESKEISQVCKEICHVMSFFRGWRESGVLLKE